MSRIITSFLRGSACHSLSVSAAASSTFYHTSRIFFSDKTPAVKRLRRVSDKFQPKPVISGDIAIQREDVSNDMSSMKDNRSNRRTVSSELKKLSLEDHTAAERDMVVKQRATEDNYEFVFGVSPCLLAITQRRRKVFALFVKDGETSLRASVLKVCEEAHRRGVPIHRVNKRDIDKMAPGRVHQGVCLQASPLTYITQKIQGWSCSRKDKTIPLWLILECVQDPMNLGAILRSAYFLGVDTVVTSISQSCPLSPVVSKASSGVMEVMDVYGYKHLGELLKMKVTQGWEVVGTVGFESRASHIHVTKCSDFTMSKPTLLLIGSEGGGLSQELLNHCQTLLTVPAGRQLFPGIESLNVSVATGILLHSLLFSRWSNKPI